MKVKKMCPKYRDIIYKRYWDITDFALAAMSRRTTVIVI